MNIEKLKKEAAKKYRPTDKRYWEYINKRLNEDMPTTSGQAPALQQQPYQNTTNQQGVPNLEDQLKSSLDATGTKNSDKIASASFELAQDRIPDTVQKTDPEYWPTVMSTAQELAGVQQNSQQNNQTMTNKMSITGQNNPQQQQPQQQSSYLNYENTLERNQWKITEQTRLDAAEQMIKDLRKKDHTDNEIVHSIVNRLGINSLDAMDLVYKNKKEIEIGPSDPGTPPDQCQAPDDVETDTLKEDNYYAHNRVSSLVTNNNPNMNFETNQDKFEWTLSSNKDKAEALVFEANFTFRVKFIIVKNNTTLWNHNWSFLPTQYNIDSVMSVNIELMNIDQSYMRPSQNSIAIGLAQNVGKTLAKVFTSYQQVFGKDHFQIAFFSTDDGRKVKFLEQICEIVSKNVPNFKYDDVISNLLTATDLTKKVYFVIVNKKGKPIKESLPTKESDSETMTFWHGGDLEGLNQFSDTPINKSGRVEFGPGMYLTTSYDVALKYSKGSRKLYQISVYKGVDASDVDLDLDQCIKFIKSNCISRTHEEIIDWLNGRSSDNKVPATSLISLIVNMKAIPTSRINILSNFLVQNGIDYEITQNAFGWHESMLVLYNLKKIANIKWITSKDKIDTFDLPLQEDDGVVMSSDFIDQVPASKGIGGETGEQINAKARRNLTVMLNGGLEAQLESVESSQYPSVLKNSHEIVNYIVDTSSQDVDEGLMESFFRGCYASLKDIPINELNEGRSDVHIKDPKKELLYSKMNPETIPPLIVNENMSILDGNHRYRVAKKLGLSSLPCYVIFEKPLESKRMYFIKNDKTGKVIGFDDKEKADRYKDTHETKPLRAVDFFKKVSKASAFSNDKVYLDDTEFDVDIDKHRKYEKSNYSINSIPPRYKGIVSSFLAISNDENEDIKVNKIKNIAYDKSFKILGIGSSRIAIGFSSTEVIKLAFNESGLVQNKVEISLDNLNLSILTQIKYEHPSGKLLIVERAIPHDQYKIPSNNKEEQIQEFTRYCLSSYFYSIGQIERGSAIVLKEIKDQIMDRISTQFNIIRLLSDNKIQKDVIDSKTKSQLADIIMETTFFKELYFLVTEHGIFDLGGRNFGWVKRSNGHQLVMLDPGYNEQVSLDYYISSADSRNNREKEFGSQKKQIDSKEHKSQSESTKKNVDKEENEMYIDVKEKLFYSYREYQLIMERQLISSFKFPEKSGDEFESEKVVNLIMADDWDRSPKDFYESYSKSKHPLMLSPYTIEDFAEMKTFKVPNHDIGFALKKWKDGTYSEIVAVHNNDSRVRGIGKLLVKAAVKMGGKYLDHFDGMLSKLYGDEGFEEYERYPYDPQYDPEESFKQKYGPVDVVYRHHKSVSSPKELAA